MADDLLVEITRLRERIMQLEQLQQALVMLPAQVPSAIWATNCELRIIADEPFPGWPKRVGLTLMEILGHPDHPGILQCRRALAGEFVSGEDLFEGRILSTRVGPLRNPAGDIIGTVGVAVDVTQTRALEQRMTEAQRAESLGVLAGGLAHDVNNLLVTILGNADLLALRDPSLANGPVQQIRTAALRAGELTRQLLGYAGTRTLAPRPCDMLPIVQEMVQLLSIQWPENITLTVQASEPRRSMLAEQAGARQVILNLLTNARDAIGNGAGSVAVAVGVEQISELSAEDLLPIEPGEYVRVSVKDSGTGISPEVRAKIFTPFFTTKPQGRGLGLAASLGIMRSHRGGLRLRSTESGAEFITLWPAITRTPRTSTPAVGRRVLVVDDDNLVRGVLVRMLQELRCEVVDVASGEAALKQLSHATFDAMLLDLNMPGQSGHQVLAEMKTRGIETPVIICSGYDKDAASADAAGFLPKPFGPDDLSSALADVGIA